MSLPSSFLVPGVYVDVNAVTSPADTEFTTVHLGQMTTGTATAGQFVQVLNGQQNTLFGPNSQITAQLNKFFANAPYSKCYAVPMEDADTATAAVFTLTLSGSVGASGTIYLKINNVPVYVGVAKGATIANVIAAIKSAINGNVTLPLTAGGETASTLDLTAVNAGTVGNDISVAINLELGQSLPKGLEIAFTSSTTGATDPSVATALAAIPDNTYRQLVFPYANSTAIGLVDDFVEARWGQTTQLRGHAVTAVIGSASTAISAATALNSKNITYIYAGKDPASATYEILGGYAGVAASNYAVDPSLSIHAKVIGGVKGDGEANTLKISDQQALLSAGATVIKSLNGGDVAVVRAVTTYKKDSLGVEGTAWQDETTPYLVAFLADNLRSYLASTLAGFKLANDGTTIPQGAKVVTPAIVKDSFVGAWMLAMQSATYIESVTQDAINDVVCERISGNANALRINVPVNLINNLMIIDASLNFKI